jgi:two-component sensor histidine kinase
MTKSNTSLLSGTKYSIDFSLVPLAIILIEFSVFIAQLASDPSISLSNLILLRVAHTLAMILISSLVSQLYIWLKKPALTYRALAATGVVVLAFGDVSHAFMADSLGIELVDLYRRIAIIVLQGTLWFPAIVLVLGYRREIIKNFNEYKRRLIVSTRLESRTSSEFKTLQKNIQLRIREELYSLSTALKDSISTLTNSHGTSSASNLAIHKLLAGEDLRMFSRRLESFESKGVQRVIRGNSLYLLARQFSILYVSTIRSAPLGKWAYILVLIGLAVPPFIYFHSFTELLFTVPILGVSSFALASLITRAQNRDSPFTLRVSLFLVIGMGLLPLATDLIWQMISFDPETQVPSLVTAVALPITYFAFMAIFQVLRPSAIRLINNDQLKASKALQDEVKKTVTEEFSMNLSHQWAVFIHGKILTRLAATSLKLEAVSTAKDPKAFSETIQSLNSLLSSPEAEFLEASKDLESEIDSRLKPWRGLLDIKISIDSGLKSFSSSRVRDLGEVLEELISNSIRHGKAKSIDLKVVRSGQKDVEVIAVDDAVIPPPETAKSTGLGTRIFNLASDGRWSITRVGSSTEFRLTMEIES